MPEDRNSPKAKDTEESMSTGRGINHHQYGTWLNWLFGDEVSREMLVRVFGFSIGIFGIGFIFSSLGGITPIIGAKAYLAVSTGYIVSILVLLTSVGYVWGSRKFLALWEEIRDAFAVDDEAYNDLVEDGLKVIYNDRAILFEFVAIFVVGWLLFREVPRIPFGNLPLVDYGYIWVLNNVIGAIGLLYVVTGIHMVVTALYLLSRVTNLPLERPQTAVSELQAFGDFTAIASTIWFLLVLLFLTGWHQFVLLMDDPPPGAIYNELAITVGLVVLVLAGIALFLVPQVAIHSALVERKRERFLELDEELDSLRTSLLAGERTHEEVSTALELHNRQYRRTENARTWLFDFRGLLQVIGSGITAVLSILLQTTDLLSSLVP